MRHDMIQLFKVDFVVCDAGCVHTDWLNYAYNMQYNQHHISPASPWTPIVYHTPRYKYYTLNLGPWLCEANLHLCAATLLKTHFILVWFFFKEQNIAFHCHWSGADLPPGVLHHSCVMGASLFIDTTCRTQRRRRAIHVDAQHKQDVTVTVTVTSTAIAILTTQHWYSQHIYTSMLPMSIQYPLTPKRQHNIT